MLLENSTEANTVSAHQQVDVHFYIQSGLSSSFFHVEVITAKE